MKKAKYTEAELQIIAKIQAQRGTTRKSAARYFESHRPQFVDVKMKAANDKPEPKTEAGSARAEGLRLYKLAGRPKKNDFIHVYGKPGVAATWERRAVMVGLDSAEKAASQFQKMLAKPAGSCLVKDEPAKKGAVA